jgi:hypothetical protein
VDKPVVAEPAVVKVEQATLTVDSTNLWSEVSKPGEYMLFIRVSGAGVAAGSDFVISAKGPGSGCESGANFISYRPEGDSQYMPKGTSGTTNAACGLEITEIPTALGRHFSGTFRGTLHAINVTTPKSKTFDLKFDVVRTK